MNTFESIIRELDKSAISINNPNWMSMTEESTRVPAYIIDKEEKAENIYKGQIVLDLGSGNGAAAFAWAREGYNVIGIELDTKLYNLSINAQKNYPELERLGVKFYNGSFYPIEYEKTDRTRTIEKKLLKEFKKEKSYLVPFTDTIYADNNIDLKDIDIFYAYAWPFQFPSIFEMFYKHARDDAKLIAIGPERDRILEKYPELKLKSETIRKK